MDAIEAARSTTDRDRRRRLYERAMTTVLEDRPIIPSFTLHNSFGVRENVENFRPHPLAGDNPDLAGEDGLRLSE
jgi:peptide/nickel transport system substrate-binding protein